ncbi:MAG TPA: ABATE domain-containing protein, partial [Streptomyces sp.]|nr:ABATE domain-containing protein [Streptomyces sp.]
MAAGATGAAAYDWRFDSGRICLDLVATAEAAPGGPESLDGPGRLGLWLVGAGLVPAGTGLAAVESQWVGR